MIHSDTLKLLTCTVEPDDVTVLLTALTGVAQETVYRILSLLE